jgi:hypothetical protein
VFEHNRYVITGLLKGATICKHIDRHQQTKHFLHNFPFMYHIKCPDDDLLIRSKLVPPSNTRLCQLLLPIYRQELNIHRSQIFTVTKTVAVVFVGYGFSLNFFAGRIRELPKNYSLLFV